MSEDRLESFSEDELPEIEQIAVVGLGGRFPGAPDVETFWQNLKNGVDSLHEFSDEELAALGIPSEITSRSNFIRRGTQLDGYDCFDAERFGFSPREAAMTDPQARLFLETAHDALEHAGYAPFHTPGNVGVFAGCNPVDYALLLGRPDMTDSLSAFDQMIGNDRDFLATRVSHRLGLTGPALNLQTACSTSLVAIHVAAQHLLNHECSMAIAGGVSLNFRQGVGYFHQQGMILSPDGYCRAFDENANGTTLGQASAAVILKRLSDAIADGDTIHAVVSGSALNNDGSHKASYTAPSIEGQAEVIANAHAMADLDAHDVTYVETHGTGTNLGDPIEIAGLTKAFRLTTDNVGFCAVGSVKTNVGHTDAAAGVTGFIKAVLSVRDGVIPKSLHFESPNTQIDFESSPFFVAAENIDWQPTTTDLRRAGISSFGIGGTNAHVIVEEPPSSPATDTTPVRDGHARILVASAPSAEGADAGADEALAWLDRGDLGHDELWTMTHGRSVHEHRVAIAVGGGVERALPRRGSIDGTRSAVWMFSGQGAQFPGMAAGLHGRLDAFTQTLDRILDQLRAEAGMELLPLLLADRDDDEAAEQLRQTAVTQPALFAMQCAVAEQLRAWGCTPRAVLGHSIGEFAAATVAGILTIEAGTSAVLARGRLMQSMVPGSMLAARLGARELEALLIDGVELATDNSTEAAVAAGPSDLIDDFEKVLAEHGVEYQRLATSHAFHTASMAEAAAEFAGCLDHLSFTAPTTPMLSNVTGTWITANEARDARRWADQIRQPVRFTECLAELAAEGDVLLEIGPGKALSSFASGHTSFDVRPTAINCVGPARESRSGDVVLVDAAARLWAEGVDVDLDAINGTTTGRRVPAPRSVMRREPCWLPEVRHVLALGAATGQPLVQLADTPTQQLPLDQWCYERSFIRQSSQPAEVGRILVLSTDSPRSQAIVEQLRKTTVDVIEVRRGATTHLGDGPWTLAPADDEGARDLANRLLGTSREPDRIVHLWLADETTRADELAGLRDRLDDGVNTLLSLARGMASLSQDRPIHIDTVAAGAQLVTGDEDILPASAAIAGPVKVIPLEYSGMTARLIDVPTHGDLDAEAVARELHAATDDHCVTALRGRHRWVHHITQVAISADSGDDRGGNEPTLVKDGGTYLIVGGVGGVGLSIAQHLADQHSVNLVLVSRAGRPDPDPTNHETTRRLEILDELEASAGGVQIIAADVTDPEQMAHAVQVADREFGGIDGVIVTAAVADNAGAIHRRSAQDAEAAIAAKVHGAVVLADQLSGRHLDFVLLSSSIASQLFHNRFGQVGYVTANSFAEAMAESGAFSADRLVTVAWDDWVDVGMSVRAAQDFSAQHGEDITLMDELHSFTPADGVEVFRRALLADAPTLFVSTTDLAARVAADSLVSSPFLEQAVADDAGDDIDGDQSLDELLRETWQALLGVGDINPDDDFFELGGDSLQIARMADRLGRALGVDVPLDLIFDNSTLAGLEEALSARSSDDADHVELAEVAGVGQVTPAQQRFFDRASSNPDHFNVSAMLEPASHVEMANLEGAALVLSARHDALRTRFIEQDGVWVQIVDESDRAAIAVDHLDLHHLNGQSQTEAEQAIGNWQAGLSLEHGPLSRLALIDFPDGRQRILLTMHHLISDRASLLTLIDELGLLLAGDELPRRTTPFSAWSTALASYLESPESSDDQAHWDRSLSEELRSPGATEEPSLNRNAVRHRLVLDPARSAAALRNDLGRVDEVALLALADAVRHSIGDVPGAKTQKVGIDVLGHGRRHLEGIDVGRTVGFFLSYSPVWIGAPTSDVRERLDELRTDSERGWTFDVLRYGRPSPGTERPRPEVLFNFVGRPIEADDSTGLTVVDEPKGDDTDPANPRGHQLAVMVEITHEQLIAVNFVYDRTRFDENAIEGLACAFTSAIDDQLAATTDQV